MSKSVLVIDTPKTCAECRFNRLEGIYVCTLTRNITDRCVYEQTKQVYCPLKPMPEKRYAIQGMKGYASTVKECKGWNACIDEILGGTE